MRKVDAAKESHNREVVINDESKTMCLENTKAKSVNSQNKITSKCKESTVKQDGTGNQSEKRKRSEVVTAKVKVNKVDHVSDNSKEVNKNTWHDVIYRIMHSQPRSDVLEIVKCKFGLPQCKLAVKYFDESFMRNPLRKLRLQIGCSGSSGLDLFIPKIHHHRHSLRVLDLSRNRLNSDDIVALCTALGFINRTQNENIRNNNNRLLETDIENSAIDATTNNSNSNKSCNNNKFEERENNVERLQSMELPAGHVVESHLSAPPSTSHSSQTREISTSLQLLDVSYNTSLGNDAVTYLMRILRNCPSLRALQLKCTGLNDLGAVEIAQLLRSWPAPRVIHRIWEETPTSSQDKVFINLNENCIGATGTMILGKGIPSHISLTLSKQHITRSTIVASSSTLSHVHKCKS